MSGRSKRIETLLCHQLSPFRGGAAMPMIDCNNLNSSLIALTKHEMFSGRCGHEFGGLCAPAVELVTPMSQLPEFVGFETRYN